MNYSLVLVLILAISVSADNWAVLVAGSNGFWNYRHQADTCHAYQILIKNGYKPENIITFSYNDIVNDAYNPVRGKLFNSPSGSDVYEGCNIDYTGKEVTPANYMAVLRGDSDAVNGKKVLGSTKEDKVFLNFVDHGAPGLIAFPNGYLFSKDLYKTFDYMFENGLYGQLVFYLETCESGSMFENLKNNTGIYGLSAANTHESSWGYYCPPDDIVKGIEIGSCLGDLFSISWMEDTDKGDLSRSLQTHFEVIRDRTTLSEVMQWGDLSFQDEPINDFLSGSNSLASGFLSWISGLLQNNEQKQSTAWDSRDNKLLFLINRFKNTQAQEDLDELEKEFFERQYFDQKFKQLSTNIGLKGQYTKSINGDCLENVINQFESQCMKLSDYGLKYVKYFTEMCDNKGLLLGQIQEQIEKVCF